MLRITSMEPACGQEVLKVEGWIAGEDVAVLERAGEAALARGHRLVLEMGGVRSIDAQGLALLAQWSRRGLALRGTSLFVRQLLERRGLRSEDEERAGGGSGGYPSGLDCSGSVKGCERAAFS